MADALHIPLLLVSAALLLAIVQYRRLHGELLRLRTEFDKRVTEEANRLASRMFEEWTRTRLREIRLSLEKEFEARVENVRKEYELRLQEWVREKEQEIRRDAIKRSISALMGRIGEYIAPLLIAREYGVNPKDMRFLGTPVDYIAFKGLSDGRPEEILFIEVKAGRHARLTSRERMVKKLVAEKKVSWVTFNLWESMKSVADLIEEDVEHLASQQAGNTASSTPSPGTGPKTGTRQG